VSKLILFPHQIRAIFSWVRS